ncbi:MAG: NADH:ubiquinone reductase (Na(+)-transporting) subunit B [Rikenellaceae bacterium]
MKFLRDYLDTIKPNFEKGGKYEKLHSTFDAFESFLFVPKHTTVKGAHIRDVRDLKRTMFMVVIALIPAMLMGMFNVGYQHYNMLGEDAAILQMFWFGFLKVLPIIIVSYVVGLGIEFMFAQLRGHEVNEGFLVTGLLIPLVVAADTPLWMVALATAFTVIIAKEVFGGTGMNVFNPALVARAFLFFAYTPFISGDRVWVAGMSDADKIVDGFSGATPLTQAVEAGSNHITTLEGLLSSFTTTPTDWLIGTMPGSIGETSFIAIMLGAAILIFTGVASWKTMISVFAGGAIMGLIFNIFGAGDPYMELPFYYHLLLGGFAFGAVFMATDPVTGSQTSKGKWIYGLLIGMLAVMIRVLNPAYPEGMMMSILFMNAMIPLIDYYIVDGNIKKRKKRTLAKN